MNLSAGLDPSAYPAAVQTALATMGVCAPSPSTPADQMATDFFQFTLPGELSVALNKYAGPPDYHGYYQASTPEGWEAGLLASNFKVLDPWDGVERQMSLDDLMAATHLAVSQGDYFVART
ncbi:hypothetical protein [Nonomuraea dietziae]|uniref:hypothetical protein n=1 Tax=Nonomuraea dietziae TaxID=65515 RepID=UPI0034454B64